MIETKTLTLQDGVLINVGRLKFPQDENGTEIIPDGITFEEREMKYTVEDGWREINWVRPLTDKERVEQLESENIELKLAAIEMADAIALQDARAAEQELALFDLANTIAEVTR